MPSFDILVIISASIAKPLDLIASSLPEKVSLKDIRYFNDSDSKDFLVSMKIVAYSEQRLSGFINYLFSQPEVISVGLGTIKKEKTSSGIEISMRVKFSGTPKQ